MPERQAGFYWVRYHGELEVARYYVSTAGFPPEWQFAGSDDNHDPRAVEVLAGPLPPPSKPEIEGEPV